MNRLKEILQERGITQTWLANELGVPRQIVNHICAGRVKLQVPMAMKIKGILGLNSIEELFKEE